MRENIANKKYPPKIQTNKLTHKRTIFAVAIYTLVLHHRLFLVKDQATFLMLTIE